MNDFLQQRTRQTHPLLARIDFTEFEKSQIEQSIPARFERQVIDHSQRLAVKTAKYQLTYHDLNGAANRIARAIPAVSGQGQQPIALLLEHDAPLIAALLGVLKSGHIYVPLDPAYPSARVSYILKDSLAVTLITNNKNLDLARTLVNERHHLLNIDELGPALDSENLDYATTPDDLAYILYTSGSTGQPKGVVQNHRNVLNDVRQYTNTLHINPDDRMTLLYSCSVNGAVRGVFGALLNGACLYPVNIKVDGLACLAGVMAREEITFYHSVPSVFRHFVATLSGQENFPKLRLIRFGGERVLAQDVEFYKRHFSADCLLYTGMGATETGHVREYFIDKHTEIIAGVVPTGYAIEDKEVLLLDDAGEVVGAGEVGEIAVKSRHLAVAYWGKPELTKTAFLPDPTGGDARIYLTGDVGRILPDGCLEHLGRKDFQVKVRGYRIEVAEIEAVLLTHPAVKEVIVMACNDPRGDQQLVAYLVIGDHEKPSIGALRGVLQTALPDYMTPAAFVFLEALPLTPNGKVDRLALPLPTLDQPVLENTYIPPRTAAERALATIWSEVFKLERIGMDDNFFELGGHSLLATQIVARAERRFDLSLTLNSLFETPTIAGMAAAIGQDHTLPVIRAEAGVNPVNRVAPRKPNIPRLARDASHRTFGLSSAQRRLWFLQQLDPGDTSYHIRRSVRLDGVLDITALRQAMDIILSRHEVLRARFVMWNDEPAQLINPAPVSVLRVIDLGAVPEIHRHEEVERLTRQEAKHVFDLSTGPLLRMLLLRLSERQHVLLLTVQHIVFDDGSVRIFWEELETLYNACLMQQPSPLPDLPIQYIDVAQWQQDRLQGAMLDAQLAYWKQQLSGVTTLELPTDFPRTGAADSLGAVQSLTLSAPLREALAALARRAEATLFMTLLAAFNILLSRYTTQEDIVIGVPIMGRTQVETEKLIGFFINNLALRTDLSGNPDFMELLRRVRAASLGAFAHQELPFEKLVEELHPHRQLDRNPLFDVLFNFINTPGKAPKLAGLDATYLERLEPRSKFLMTLYVRESESGLALELVYRRALFSSERMAAFLEQLRYLLEQIVAAPQAAIASYSLVTPSMRALLPDPRVALTEPYHAPVTESFFAWAERSPQLTALTQGDRIWTYGGLGAVAQILARHLITRGVEPGAVVAVLGEKSVGLITAMLAVLASGGVLLTIDRHLPVARRRLMIEEANAAKIVYAGDHGSDDEWLNAAELPELIALDAQSGGVVGAENLSDADTTRLPTINPSDAAYIFFTSGTTGKPKGVLGSHKGLSHFLHWQRQTFAVGPGDRCAQLTGLSFDPVLRDVFLPLCSGATLCLPDDSDEWAGERIIPWLRRENITIFQIVPALAQSWLAGLDTSCALPSVRWIFFMGEPLSGELVRRWRAALPGNGAIVNFYGPTETTLVKCYYPVPADPAPGVQPIGRALPDTQLLVLNVGGQLCGMNEPGEIAIRTSFRSLGYINSVEENQKRFIKNPFRDDAHDLIYLTGDRGRYRADGSLDFLGRLDDQVKIRGVRVEPGEVAAVLAKHPCVQSCAVLACRDEQSQNFLAAYLVLSDSTTTVAQLRSYLGAQLSAAMVPTVFITLDDLPLAPNGKLDRRALPAPERLDSALENDFVAPRTPMEEQLARILADVLKLERVGIHHDFFEMGGHSLLATQVISRVRDGFNIALPLRSLFETPTVVGLADALVQSQLASLTPEEAERMLAEF